MILPKFDNIILMGQLKQWQDRIDKERKTHPLKYLFWETTRRCNLDCKHCGSDCGSDRDSASECELSTEEIKGAFRSIAEDLDPKNIMIAVTGGEPLLRKDLFEVMGYASDLGFKWGMVTNGTLVDEETVKKCKEAGMNTVTVSIDGLKDSHDHLRGRKGSFEKAVNALKLFKDGKFEVVQATTCVSQYNINELPDLYELFKDLNIDEWRILTINPIGRAKEDPKLFLKPAQLRSVLNFIKERRKFKGLKTTFEEEGFLGPEFEGKVRDGFYFCPAGINIASILADGSIGSCPNLSREYIQGNIRNDRFKEVWDNGFKKMRNLEWKKKGMCAKCAWWSFCRGNSLHLWDFDSERPVVCHIHSLERSSP
ncbi:radical SAM/SPASM domain-containing protein [Methanocella sp. CWC-04]|uniref:Radical SAM/SPASM domain-containing protein n=1 Tax=Methanooceanicella nereidis TaxID=2052831 RepID=A0AAP2W6N0_9EURY|nr:radical SAM protein [Methanocella sp. CWC-04]MCD1295513.1 radical SAM/SPASM domain-containing protein [Methanocella sp. CWC-04]